MDFEHLFDPPPLVQKKKKYATFTLREIGGPEEIGKWRAIQASKEEAYRMRLEDREKRSAMFESESGQVIDKPVLAAKESWATKVERANAERVRLAKAEETVTEYPPWEALKPPKQSLFTKITSFLKKLWNNANFS